MLVDTDVLIWNLRGNRAAAQRGVEDAAGSMLTGPSYSKVPITPIDAISTHVNGIRF